MEKNYFKLELKKVLNNSPSKQTSSSELVYCTRFSSTIDSYNTG